MTKIIIADVLYTETDETFYVLNRSHDNASKYTAGTLEDTFYNLIADGWQKRGKVNRHDGSKVDMLKNDKDYIIAVWEEPSLSRLEQMKLYVENVIKRNGIGHEAIPEHTIIAGLPLVFGRENNENHPSDYCYNLWNERNERLYPGFDWPVFFERTDSGRFRILGSDYPYTGEILDAKTQGREEKSLGYWINGKRYKGKLPIYPDDLPDASKEYLEGSKKTVTVNTYERNPAARKFCIEHYGAVCFICRFDFSKVYGDEFERMIHVHHLKMISKTDGEYVLDPVNDLRPVCHNCHMVLHSKKAGYTIEEVKAMLKKSRGVQ